MNHPSEVPENSDDANRSGTQKKQRRRLTLPLWVVVAFVGAVVLFVGYSCTRLNEQNQAAYPPASGPSPADTSAQITPPVAVSDTVTLTEMRNVSFRIDEQIALHIKYLRGTVNNTREGSPIDFGNKGSFQINIRAAEVALSVSELSLLMNRYVFAYPKAPLKNLRITTEDNQLKQKGTIRKVVNIPFEIVADIQATPDGMIRLHPTSMKIFHLFGEGVMKTLSIELNEVLDLSQAKGVTVEKNDLLLDPDHLLPPPAIRGRISAVRIEGDDVIQIFGSPEDSLSQVIEHLDRPDPAASNYLFFRGGTLHFGKLFMVQSDLQIIDEAPGDPFDFYIDRYVDQLVAGYSETTPDFGLEAYMPDFNKLKDPAEHIAPEHADSLRHTP